MKKIMMLMIFSLNVMASTHVPIKELKQRCETGPDGQTYCYEVFE